MSSGPRRCTRRFVRRSSFAAPVNSTSRPCDLLDCEGRRSRTRRSRSPIIAPYPFSPSATAARNSRPPSIRSSSSLRSSGRELLDPRVRGVAGHLLDAEVAVGAAGDLRQVRDRDHLRPLGEPAERVRRRRGRSCRRCRRRSRRRPSSRRPRPRRSRARSSTARRRRRSRRPGRTGDRGSAGSGTTDVVGAGRRRLALAQLDAELALAHADRPSARRRPRPRTAQPPPAGPAAAPSARAATRPSASLERGTRGRDRIEALLERRQLRLRLDGPGEQLLVRLAAKAPPGGGDPVEIRLHLLEPAGVGFEQGQERPQRRSPSPAAAARRRAARRPRGGARARAAPPAASARSAAAVSPAAPSPSSASSASAAAAVPSTSSVRCRRRSRSLAQRVLEPRLHAVGVLDEGTQLRQARLRSCRAAASARRTAAARPRAPATPRGPRPGGGAAPRRR